MSYLWNANSAWEVSPERMQEAQLQYESMALLYQRILDTCEKKCVNVYGEPDLTKGEVVCIDRCVAKYTRANQTVGLKIKEMNINPMATNGGMMDVLRRSQ